jgi:DNA-binding NtrC family response regulator
MIRGRLLVVDDDATFRATTAALLREDGHEVMTAANADEAMRALQAGACDLLLLDIRMPGIDGIQLTQILRQRGDGIPILIISGYGTVESTVQVLHSGGDDVLTKPVDPAVLSTRVRALLARRPPTPALDDMPSDLIGRSHAMEAVFTAIRLVAATDATVLITGETGTGKEQVARAVHDRSPRRHERFVAVNSAAFSDGVLESEIFGHVRGAFTGAVRDRPGVFEVAHGGTLFLDEIGEMSAAMQQRLLRALQEREVTRVGTATPVRVNVRVVAATNRNLSEAVAAGRFREDLYYRFNVFRMELPPLRERREDIPLLVDHVLRRATPTASPGLCSPLAMRMLQAYQWPGNVRELIAALESSRIRAHGSAIEAHHLPPEVRGALANTDDGETTDPRRDPAGERARIAAALQKTGGRLAQAAQILGIGRTTLWRKLRQHVLLDDSSETGP